MPRIFFILVIVGLCFNIFSCEESRVFDKNIPLSKQGWSYDEPQIFDVNIGDTSVTYNLYINVRHTDIYAFNNLWVKMTTVFPDSTRQENKLNVELSKPTGEWTGICVDGICFNSVLMQNNFKLPQKGKYSFILEQDMRTNPLADVLDIGIKIEKFQ